MTLLRELIDIPDSVPASRFVVSLSQGVLDPDATLGEYVVTPQLQDCFDKALSLIQNSLANRASSGTYLHGSFGSGKSHFMAVLSLILKGEPKARGIPELADVIAKHNAWMGGKKFLLVPYHMIGAPSLEGWLLNGYADYVAKLHPEAPRRRGVLQESQRRQGRPVGRMGRTGSHVGCGGVRTGGHRRHRGRA